MAKFETDSALSGTVTEFGNMVEHFKLIQEAYNLLNKIEADVDRLNELSYLFCDDNDTNEMIEDFHCGFMRMQELLKSIALKTGTQIINHETITT